MNIAENRLLRAIIDCPNHPLRKLSFLCGCSLGWTSQKISEWKRDGVLDSAGMVTSSLLRASKSQSLIILAAGPGLRSLPLERDIPKGLLHVRGETLIKRIIRQAKEAGIERIEVVVGYHKESFEFLIDKYGVTLISNPDFAADENLRSLFCAKQYLENSYIVPSDLYFQENPFCRYQFTSWYATYNAGQLEPNVVVAAKERLAKKGKPNYRAVGLAYIRKEEAASLASNLSQLCIGNAMTPFWETALYEPYPIEIYANDISDSVFFDINSYEDLRLADPSSEDLLSCHIQTIISAFGGTVADVTDIRILKKGMTNRSFLFRYGEEQLIMRIPGEGTEELINREQECKVYEAIRPLCISDEALYMDPKTGVKITRFIPGARNADPTSNRDVADCMIVLKAFHSHHLSVPFEFDIWGQILHYESLMGGKSLYEDYDETKAKVFRVKQWIDSLPKEKCLCHIDSVPDNFLICPNGEIRLIDWEYAAVQDPHVDIAMFGIYSCYGRSQIDYLIDAYFAKDGCDLITRLKIYGYVSMCGLLWSNWCEYKKHLGVEFGDYSLAQYRFGKVYAKLVLDALEKK